MHPYKFVRSHSTTGENLPYQPIKENEDEGVMQVGKYKSMNFILFMYY